MQQKVAESKMSAKESNNINNNVITIADRMNNNSIQAEKLMIDAVESIYSNLRTMFHKVP
jgi:hypothetical protein